MMTWMDACGQEEMRKSTEKLLTTPRKLSAELVSTFYTPSHPVSTREAASQYYVITSVYVDRRV